MSQIKNEELLEESNNIDGIKKYGKKQIKKKKLLKLIIIMYNCNNWPIIIFSFNLDMLSIIRKKCTSISIKK